MASNPTVPVRMDEQGRVTVPEEVREALDVKGEKAMLQIEVELVESSA